MYISLEIARYFPRYCVIRVLSRNIALSAPFIVWLPVIQVCVCVIVCVHSVYGVCECLLVEDAAHVKP